MIGFMRGHATAKRPVLGGASANRATRQTIWTEIDRCVREELYYKKIGEFLMVWVPGQTEHARQTRLLGSGCFYNFTERCKQMHAWTIIDR